MTVEKARESVRAGGLLPTETAIVVMLSGGRDSVCLLDLVVALLGPERVWALHINYGLRGGSEGDELHCRALCELLGVRIEVVRAGRGEGQTGNLHAWARDLRYGAAQELAERLDGQSWAAVSPEGVSRVGGFGKTIIATGHTATDQIETILYRLASSPGRRALLGMPVSEGRLVRPLLGLTRDTTGAYCLERKLAWREDESNDNERYARARVRHGLVKALDAVHPAAQANVLRTAELLRGEKELLDGVVDEELGGCESISIERLKRLPPALQRLVVIRLAENAAGTFVPQAGERVAEIFELAARGGRAELHVGGLVGAIVEEGMLHMVRIPRRMQRPSSR